MHLLEPEAGPVSRCRSLSSARSRPLPPAAARPPPPAQPDRRRLPCLARALPCPTALPGVLGGGHRGWAHRDLSEMEGIERSGERIERSGERRGRRPAQPPAALPGHHMRSKLKEETREGIEGGERRRRGRGLGEENERGLALGFTPTLVLSRGRCGQTERDGSRGGVGN